MASSAAPNSTTCTFCQKSFGRSEHLKRHMLIHTKEHSLKCRTCSKTFIRKDALQRHEATHDLSTKTLLKKGTRACSNCALAKARCTRDPQCKRCEKNDLSCAYPEANMLPVQSPHEPLESSQAPEQTFHETPGPGPVHSFNHQSQNQDLFGNTSYQYSQVGQPSLEFGLAGQTRPFDLGFFDPDFWNPNILSAINWLGADITTELHALPDPYTNNFSPLGLSTQQLYDSSWQSNSPLELRPHHESRIGEWSEASPSDYAVGTSASFESQTATTHVANDGSAETGQYYVDGEVARLPKGKRHRMTSESSTRYKNRTCFHFSLQQPPGLSKIHEQAVNVDTDTYKILFDLYQRTCLASTAFAHFSTVDFPSIVCLEYLTGLYFEFYHQALPFLQPKFFQSSQPHWLLLLVLMALGSHFIEGDDTAIFVLSIHEFVRRVLHTVKENANYSRVDDSTQSTIEMLHAVGIAYCGDDQLAKHGLKMQPVFMNLNNSLHLDQQRARMSTPDQQKSTEEEWTSWRAEESRRRTRYCAWMLDSMWTVHFQTRPMMSLKDIRIPLPCHEKLWDAGDSQQWKNLMNKSLPTPSLTDALQALYVEKRLSPELGEFARILVIHGIFHQSWEMERHFGHALSHWNPTAQKQVSQDVLPQFPIWLPSIPAYTKWRNSACDCIDILHWSANATIGIASGIEHPTVMHLHLARVVLLTPFNSIVRFAKFLTRENLSQSPEDLAADREAIKMWATQDQYKARLAVIHAGVLFWHIRRFSVSGFYEPSSVAIAALALWAFSAFSVKQTEKGTRRHNSSLQQEPHRQDHSHSENDGAYNGGPTQQQTEIRADESDEDSAMCNIILLDRPTDDELVQEFVRRGHTMRANMQGVGDLYGSRAPERVLLEGRKLLSTLNFWGITAKWIKTLDRLAEVARREILRNNGGGTGTSWRPRQWSNG